MARKKKQNLKFQMLQAIEKSFAEGRDKHSDKANGERGSAKIYSYKDRKALIDTASQFANWVKETHPSVKNANEIRTNQIQEFLNLKAETCSNATIKTYTSRFNKLDKILDNSYGSYERQCDNTLIRPISANEKTYRDIMMTREDYQKISDHISNSRSEAKVAWELAGRVGLRVAETTSVRGTDYNPNTGVLSVIGAKGGRDRDIVVKEADKPYFEDLRDKFGNSRVCSIEEKSVSQAVNRWFEKKELTEYIEKKTSIHAVRKMVAQEMYDELKESGLSCKESWNEVSHFLGHGSGRDDLYKSYITTP